MPLRQIACLNESCLNDFSPYALLAGGRHFSLVTFAQPFDEDDEQETEDAASYYLAESPEWTSYYEAGEWLEVGTGRQLRPVPADGHCLITSLYFAAYEQYPSLAQIQTMRQLLAASLTKAQIRDAFASIKEELLQHPEAFPLDGGRFATLGPRLSALLLDDPVFMAVRHARLAPLPCP